MADLSQLSDEQLSVYRDLLASKGGQQATPKAAEAPGMLDSIGHSLKTMWDEVNPVSQVQGAADAANSLVRHPVDTVMGVLTQNGPTMQKAVDSFKKGDYTSGAAHLIYSLIPLIGPGLDKAGDMAAAGDIPGSLGKTAGIAANVILPMKAPEIVNAVKGASAKLGTAASRDLMQRALKPGVADAPELSDVRNVVDTALEHKIPVTEGGLTRLQSIIADYGQKVNDIVGDLDVQGKRIDPNAVASRIDQAKTQFGNQVNPTKDLRTLANSKQEFLGSQTPTGSMAPSPMLPSKAQALKTGTYQQTYAKAGESSATQLEAEKALARGLKEELEAHAPELKGLNAKQGAALDLEGVLTRAVRRAGNSDLVNLGDAATATGGTIVGGPAGGAAATFLKKVVSNPALQSKLAIALSQKAAMSGQSLSATAAAARATAILNALQSSAEGKQ